MSLNFKSRQLHEKSERCLEQELAQEERNLKIAKVKPASESRAEFLWSFAQIFVEAVFLSLPLLSFSLMSILSYSQPTNAFFLVRAYLFDRRGV